MSTPMRRCQECGQYLHEGHSKECNWMPEPRLTEALDWPERYKRLEDQLAEANVSLLEALASNQKIYEAEAEQLTRPFRDDSNRLKALWLYPPVDIAFWKVAYPNLDAFRVAIDRYTKKKQDDKWGYPS